MLRQSFFARSTLLYKHKQSCSKEKLFLIRIWVARHLLFTLKMREKKSISHKASVNCLELVNISFVTKRNLCVQIFRFSFTKESLYKIVKLKFALWQAKFIKKLKKVGCTLGMIAKWQRSKRVRWYLVEK